MEIAAAILAVLAVVLLAAWRRQVTRELAAIHAALDRMARHDQEGDDDA